VVSIIISKDVPVFEQYYTNPFEDIPPEWQEFFGPFFQFKIPQYRQKGTEKQEIGGGTGFIVSSDGLILTNKHVVSDKNASYTVYLNTGEKYEAKVLAVDPIDDIALIKIEAHNLPTLTLGDSDGIKVGQTVIAIGNALGEFRNTVSVGVVSGLSRSITASDASGNTETIDNVIQTDAAINLGNSGGPLINLKGEVIGINTAIASGAENIGFAIPINRAKKAIESYQKFGKITAPYIGIRYILINSAIQKQNNLPVDYGAWINAGSSKEPAVISNSPAAQQDSKKAILFWNSMEKKLPPPIL
jgi:Trypsin-like serine proteases, typically periplasmic, contain C-terminal PDZ domain